MNLGWREILYRKFHHRNPFVDPEDLSLAGWLLDDGMRLCCYFLPRWYWVFVGKFVREVKSVFEGEAYYKNQPSVKPEKYQCYKCGVITTNDKADGWMTYSTNRTEHGLIQLCAYCNAWRVATAMAVREGNLKLREQREFEQKFGKNL